MVEELKECPFCGVKLSIDNWEDVDFDVTHEDEPEARRRKCPLACYYDYSSMKSAVKAANMRYEHTCNIIGVGENTDADAGWKCTACGFVQPYGREECRAFNYCPNCGAKVVSE